ncbi:hypothetical protein MUO66_00615 [Candidatus Bathyarchaeota archaeon]|nr:hypothetical protein [Candidatus Bathyarchaeota archaeon]
MKGIGMSSRLGQNNSVAFLQILPLVLMLISFLAIFNSDIEEGYKIGIVVLVFAIIFLANIATQALKQGIPQKNSD